MKKLIYLSSLIIMSMYIVFPLFAEEEIIFIGIPKIRGNYSANQTLERLPNDKSAEFTCIITKIDDTYYWTSRNNIELIPPIRSGTFKTFFATNGSGYIRIINPKAKDASMVEFDYIEHLLLGFETITYWGKNIESYWNYDNYDWNK